MEYISFTSIKMGRLILSIERCGETAWIDVITDIHVEVSRVIETEFSVTLLKITSSALSRLQMIRFENNFLDSFVEYY
jgi:hypothetical protein